jgi:predicted MFS family arabinose efflux permease
MTTSTHLLRRKRFLPLFATQLFNAFNDNLYKTAMVLFVVYQLYNSTEDETLFSAVASFVFILPFFIFSALAGQLADMRDKALIIRRVKLAEIGLMLLGASGLYLAWQDYDLPLSIPLYFTTIETSVPIVIMLLALFWTGVQSAFFGPIKYAILPQHLKPGEVLAGTGLVEAGTYVAILGGTILAGWVRVETAMWLIIVTAIAGYMVSRNVPDAPPMGEIKPIDRNLWRSSIRLIDTARGDRQTWLAIIAISFFWTIGAVLFIQFPPLAKNILYASPQVASLFLVMFSIGVAMGSVGINRLLKGQVSARYAPVSVIAMGLFVVIFYLLVRNWNGASDQGLLDIAQFIAQPLAVPVLLSLLGIAVAGGMFVVPLYAFLTTRSKPDAAARVIAANNIVNSGAMVAGSALSVLLTKFGLSVVEQVLLSAVMCLISAVLGRKLLVAETREAKPA